MNSVQFPPLYQYPHLSNHEATEHAMQTMRGIAAPEPSHVSPPAKSAVVTPVAKDSKMGEAASQSSIGDRQILDTMVRLDYNIDVEKGGSLISFYCEYQEYLQENNLIDPEQAEQLREKKKIKEAAPKQPA